MLADWKKKTYIHNLCADTGCCLEDLLSVIADRDGSKKSMLTVSLDVVVDDDDNRAEFYTNYARQRLKSFYWL